MTSPHDILTAYSNGKISSSQAIHLLHLETFRDLLAAMADAGHPLPKPPQDQIEKQLEIALPLLQNALNNA